MLQLVLDGTHVAEASSQKQVQKLDGVPVLFVEVLGGIERVDDLPIDELGLEALEM